MITPSAPLVSLSPAEQRSMALGVVASVIAAFLIWGVGRWWWWLGRQLRESNATSRERARRYAEVLAESHTEYTQSLADHGAASTQEAVYVVGLLLFTSFAGYAGMSLLNPSFVVGVAVLGSGLIRATNAKNRIADAFKAAGYALEFRETGRVFTTDYDVAKAAMPASIPDVERESRPG